MTICRETERALERISLSMVLPLLGIASFLFSASLLANLFLFPLDGFATGWLGVVQHGLLWTARISLIAIAVLVLVGLIQVIARTLSHR